jgi:hypothetical protein
MAKIKKGIIKLNHIETCFWGFSYVFDALNVVKNKIADQGTAPSTNY